MAEQPPAFVVVDKRKFTAEGEIREGYVAPEPEHVSEPEKVPDPVAAASQTPGHAPGQAQPGPADNVVTMPARAAEAATQNAAYRAADDLAEEDLAGQGAPQEALDFEGDEAIGQPRSAAETAAQDQAYRQSKRDLDALLQQANPGMQAPGVVGFEHVIQSFYLSAIMAMGAGSEPGQKPRIDILAARQSIDMLSVIEDKTKGNLSPEEQQLLQGITFELRMMFLELTNAISAQAHQPPGGMPRPVPPGGGLR
jgi:hypothetical protein